MCSIGIDTLISHVLLLSIMIGANYLVKVVIVRSFHLASIHLHNSHS
jgi:hypothetical protein